MRKRWVWFLAGGLLLLAALVAVGFTIIGGQSTMETVTFSAPDGLTVSGDLYLTRDKTAPFVLLFHQAGYSRGEYREIAPKLNHLGYNCLAVDQRSGRSAQGVANETSKAAKEKKLPTGYTDAYPDLIAALDYVKERFSPEDIIVWGSSYSASLVLILAAEYPEEIDAVLSFSPGEYFLYNDQRIEDDAAQVTQPVFITSAKHEENGWRKIADRISSPGCLFFVPEEAGVHGSSALLEQTPNHAEYWGAVEEFLSSLRAE